ncbi:MULTISPECIES: hypothetical protein [unclassified Psychrobacter]|uniref:hypothetical protein n=1 Tax=unclassified Psychrobacter TaxID=196806 RepID=UPI00086A7B55|nr:hypothetical protein [Psychrobacter sp. B29-1]OEH67978.1 MAG: hypothetical protein BAX61_03965 [Psychrobacter sp. B29-1]|tara:strand:- start:979 stop:1758 length:780 start_codon:yes stop_codon:yes gene_type:complete
MNSPFLLDSFQNFGIYGLICYVNQHNDENNPRVQAYNLLKAGRELAKKTTDARLNYLPNIAFDLNSHESIYRIAALLYIELDHTHEALKCLSYLHYYYEEQSVEPHKQYVLIKRQLADNNKDGIDIEAFIEEYQGQYQQQKIANNIKEYSESIPTEDLSEQKMYFKRLYRRYGVQTLIFAIENDTRFNNRVKAVLLIRASRAIGAIAEEGTSIESVFANKALQLDESKAVVENSYQAYLRAGDLNKLAQLKEKYSEILL